MKNFIIGQKEIIHFVGIGGIGMSGLAKVMKTMKFNVQGSDISKNKNTDSCKKVGIKIFIGHHKKNISNATIVVKSSAIKKNNTEILQAKKKHLPIYERAEMLANIVALKKNIIVTGSHGKTTTTSLIAKILSEAELDPTIINGGVINSINSNAKLGKGDLTVLEADESDGSFLKLPVNYSVITNLDLEHLDFYKTYENLKKAFIKFINKTPPIGKCFICSDNADLRNILKNTKTKNYETYGFNKNCDYQICNEKFSINNSKFDLTIKDKNKNKKYFKNIIVSLMGKHNILNTTAAISICLNLGIAPKIIKKALYNFSGVQRRMTKIFSKNKVEFYDDYAHHPTEIFSVLESVKKVFQKRKIISIFQPHRYSRVNSLKYEFSKAFRYSDFVILCPLYSAGEKKIKSYNHDNFSKLISKNSKTKVILIKNEIELTKYLKKNLMNNEIVIGMGAGSISQWMRNLKGNL